MTLAARILVVVLAALCAISLASALGPVRDQAAGQAAVSIEEGRPGPAGVARAHRLLERAAAHTRSTGPELNLAQLDAFTNRPERAVPRLRSIVAREPENFEAWSLLAQIARTVDPATAARARARALQLSPPVPVER